MTPTEEHEAAPPDSDLLWGAAEIGAFLGMSPARVRYLIQRKRLPATKLGHRTLLASKRRLRRAMAEHLA